MDECPLFGFHGCHVEVAGGDEVADLDMELGGELGVVDGDGGCEVGAGEGVEVFFEGVGLVGGAFLAAAGLVSSCHMCRAFVCVMWRGGGGIWRVAEFFCPGGHQTKQITFGCKVSDVSLRRNYNC